MSNNALRGATSVVLTLLVSATVAQVPAPAQPSSETSDPQTKTELNTITVEAQRESLKRQVRTFVSAIAAQRFGDWKWI